jgi:hypothetical protein
LLSTTDRNARRLILVYVVHAVDIRRIQWNFVDLSRQLVYQKDLGLKGSKSLTSFGTVTQVVS